MNMRNSIESSKKHEAKNISVKEKDWVLHDDIHYHPELLKKGFMVVKPYNEAEDEVPVSFVTENSFTIKDRKLRFAADVHDNNELSTKFEQTYPKQAANLLSRIPALNPYNEWNIYFVKDINSVDLEKISGKAIILTPTMMKAKSKKDSQTSDAGGGADKLSIKKGFVTAHFVKQGKFLNKKGSILANEINLLAFTPEERAYIETLQVSVMPAGLDVEKEGAALYVPQIAKKILSKNNISPFDVFIHNEERRDEFFVPLDDIGLYVCPWLPKQDEDNKNLYVNNFVTAMCMFGPVLKGIDREGNEFILIKHGKKFYKDQKVARIQYNSKAANPYETMLFSEFERLVAIINAMSDPHESKKLLCHVPYIDYMLFGVELFVRGRITLDALGQFFKCVLKKKEEYVSKVTSICQQYDITVKIESPFENLLPPLSIMNMRNEEAAKTILSELKVSCMEVNPTTINEKQRKENEQRLVQSILEKLRSNVYIPKHQSVWEDFLNVMEMQQKDDLKLALEGVLKQLNKSTENQSKRQIWDDYLKKINEQLAVNETPDLPAILTELKYHALKLDDRKTALEECSAWDNLLKLYNKHRITNLEDIMKHGNARMLAFASCHSKPYETCSILPLTEKRIPMEYSAFQQMAEKMEREEIDQARQSRALSKTGGITTTRIAHALNAISLESNTANPGFTPTYAPTLNITYLDPLVTYGLKHRAQSTHEMLDHDNDQSMHPQGGMDENKIDSYMHQYNEKDEDDEMTQSDDCSNQGPPFYFSQCPETLNSFLKIGLNYAYKNVGLFDRVVKGILPKSVEHESERKLQRVLEMS